MSSILPTEVNGRLVAEFEDDARDCVPASPEYVPIPAAELPMDEARKQAYRYLLYRAMLDIRTLHLPSSWFRLWNPFFWRREHRRVCYARDLADWLHNLALCSSLDFVGFKEEWFWREFEALRSRYPELGLECYRKLFEQQTTLTAEKEFTPPVNNR